MADEINHELVISRVFNAPKEMLWKYWSDPKLFKKWHGPKIFTCPVSQIDFRVGGKYLHCMKGTEGDFKGKEFWSTGTYIEIIPFKKIVATDSFADKNGRVVPATYYGMEDFPTEMKVTVEFEEQNGKTKMTLRHVGIKQIDDRMREDMAQGWNESFDKIVAALKWYLEIASAGATLGTQLCSSWGGTCHRILFVI